MTDVGRQIEQFVVLAGVVEVRFTTGRDVSETLLNGENITTPDTRPHTHRQLMVRLY